MRLVLRRWRIVLLLITLSLLGALTYTVLATPKYESDVRAFVATKDSGGGASDAYAGGLFTQQRVKSYAEIVNSPAVTGPVAERLRLGLSSDDIAERIEATAPEGTVLIDIAVRDDSPERARRIADAVGAQFAALVSSVESPRDRAASPVTVTIVRPATLPADPVQPKVLINMLVGLLGGIALGVVGAVVRDALDTTINSAEELERATGGSVSLATVGYDGETERLPLVPPQGTSSLRSEAYRVLRTHQRFADVDTPVQVVLVSSAISGEGKTVTACNLALTMASTDARVILVDADLRRPKVAEYMGLEGAVGLTDALLRRADLDDVLQRWGATSLEVLTGGTLPPNPSELLGSRQMAELVRELRTRADIVVIDAPPLLPVTDAAVLSKICDGVVLVVQHGRTKRDQVEHSLASLRTVGARIFGTVLNKAPSRKQKSYGYYGLETEESDLDALDLDLGRADAGSARERA